MEKIIVVISVFIITQTAWASQHKGLYNREVRDFEVVVPQKVTPGGVPTDGDLSHHHRGRRVKRDVLGETLHYRLNISGQPEILDLEPSASFISQRLVVAKGGRTRGMSPHKTACHYRGVVRHRRGSSVALSACHGLAGVVRLKGTEYFLEPSIGGPVSRGEPRHHILYRRAAVTAGKHRKRKKKKRKKKHEKNCGTREPRRLSRRDNFGRRWKRGRHNRGRLRSPRSVSRERHVETLLVADASMVEFHQDGDVETYLLTVMNMVAALYQEPSIGNFINIVVVKIVLVEDNSIEGLNITVNADHALNSFCTWQEKQNPPSDSDPDHHDVAILITRKDICSRRNTPCSTLGVAHVAGMCERARSCNINEDNGMTLAHTVAHELGHNFGMFHDSAKSGCVSRRGATLHVMTPIFEADSLNIAWSECSRREITNFLDQGLGSCLEDPPLSPEDYRYPELPAGAMYNADHQCRLQFGPDSAACDNEEVCSRLWCKVDGMCTTNLYPAAPGTHCGKHKWCVNQACVTIGESAEPIDGGWGEWGEWSECSRTCGAGVSIKERLCDHPTPGYGGSYCLGERRRYKVCNTNPCPDSPLSFRAVQCSSYNTQPYYGKNYTWLPYFQPSESCELYCTDTEDTNIVSFGDSAADGTPCNLGSRDMCISGICRKVGCDWVVDSDAVEDRCGVCRGNSSLCSIQNGYFNITHGEGIQEVALIPRGARNIRVEELKSSRNVIGIGNAARSKFYLNGKGKSVFAGEYMIAGSAALYERQKEREKLRIPGPIKEAILLYVMFHDDNPGVYYEYTEPNEKPLFSAQYEWKMSDWSTCSATCGGGQQVSKATCLETLKRVMAPGKCNRTTRPPDAVRTCNLHPCPVRWWIGPWQLCPVTCGELALRRRTVLCVSGTTELALPDTDCAGQVRPRDTEPCPDVPPCLSPHLLATMLHANELKPEVLQLKYDSTKWTILPWSQCSVTCGVGFKKRTIFCATKKCDIYTKPISVKQCFRNCNKKEREIFKY